MDAELREKVARACYAGDPLVSGGRLKTWDDLPENSRIMYRQQADALAPIIAEVEAAARADEREKAANMAGLMWTASPDEIAAAIRAQKEPTT
jgi:hypothetical protein